MQTHYIALDDFCALHDIEASFISSLQQTGLIEITTIEQAGFLEESQLQQAEKYIRFHNGLDINLEGIETITHMLQRISLMNDEIVSLRNRLRLYETE
jgi:hypothetical protein